MPFRPSFPSFSPKTKKSSTEWLRRQSQDPFVKQRALGATPSTLGSLGYTKDGTSIGTSSLSAFRSRSAFKLIEMHEKYDQFLTKPDVRVVVDLGAAPGGWSQVVSQLVNEPQAELEVEEAEDEVRPEEEKLDQGDEGLEGTEVDLDIFEDPRQKRKKKRPIQRKSITKSLVSEPLDFYDPLNIDEDLERLSLESSSSSMFKVKVVAVDRLGMDAMPGVHVLKADFLHPRTEDMIRALIEHLPSSSSSSLSSSYSPKLGLSNPAPPKVDIVLSDIASNVTGVPASDSEANLQVAQAVFTFTKNYLRSAEEIGRARGGVLLLKHFAHPSMDNFRKTVLEPHFRDVIYTKPKASRQESREGYFLCRGYYPPVL